MHTSPNRTPNSHPHAFRNSRKSGLWRKLGGWVGERAVDPMTFGALKVMRVHRLIGALFSEPSKRSWMLPCGCLLGGMCLGMCEVRRIKQARPCECPFAEIRGALLREAQPRKPPTKPAAAGLKMRVPFMRTTVHAKPNRYLT